MAQLSAIALLLSMLAWTPISFAQSQQLKLGDFNRVELDGPMTVLLLQSEDQSPAAEISGSAAQLDAVHVEVVDRVLYLSVAANHDSQPLAVGISVNELKEVVSLGDATIAARNLQANALTLEAQGASRFAFEDLLAAELVVIGAGQSEFLLSGSAERQVVELSGSSVYLAPSLAARSSEVQAAGRSDLELQVTQHMHVDIEGRARVRYIEREQPVVAVPARPMRSVRSAIEVSGSPQWL